MHWKRTILIFLQEMHSFGNRKGSGCGLGTQNVGFPKASYAFYDSTSGRGQKCANALQTKNIDFPAGKCAFLETEEGLDLFWEPEILIFLQESVNF